MCWGRAEKGTFAAMEENRLDEEQLSASGNSDESGLTTRKLKDPMLTDNLWRLMWKMSLPGIGGMLVISLNNFVDAIFVGQLISSDALAAIALALPLTMVSAAFTSLLGVGSSSLLSRMLGEGDLDGPARITVNVVLLGTVFSLLLTALFWFLAHPLIVIVGGVGIQADMGAAYFRIFALATIFRLPGIATNMLIRAEGKINVAMIFVAIAMILNMVLNPIFISTLGLGIEGAAWATNLSMFIYALLNAQYFLRRKTRYPILRRHMRFSPELLPPILGVGISAALMQGMFMIQQAVVFNVTKVHAEDSSETAFMGACYRIIMLAIVPVFGFLQAFQPVVGINYGAKFYHRSVRALWVFIAGGTLFELAIWVPMEIWPRPFLGILLKDFELDAEHLYRFRLIMLSLPALPFLFLAINFFQALGRGAVAGFLISGRQLLFFVPGIYLLARAIGVRGVYAGHPAVDALAVVLTATYTYLEVRRLNRMSAQKTELSKTNPD